MRSVTLRQVQWVLDKIFICVDPLGLYEQFFFKQSTLSTEVSICLSVVSLSNTDLNILVCLCSTQEKV